MGYSFAPPGWVAEAAAFPDADGKGYYVSDPEALEVAHSGKHANVTGGWVEAIWVGTTSDETSDTYELIERPTSGTFEYHATNGEKIRWISLLTRS